MRRPEGRPPGLLLRLLELGVVLGALLRRQSARRAPPGVDPEDLAAGYELSDMRVGVVVASALALLLALGLVLVLVSTLQAALTGIPFTISPPADLINGLQAAPAPTPPPPRLEASPGEELAAARAAASQQNTGYGWVDRQAGVVSIPVDRAIELLAERGLPARPGPPAGADQDQGTSSPSSASSGRVNERIVP